MERRPLKDFGMITETDYTGKTFEDAKGLAENNGFIVRVVEKDGESFVLTMDHPRSDRINFRLRNDKIIGVYGG